MEQLTEVVCGLEFSITALVLSTLIVRALSHSIKTQSGKIAKYVKVKIINTIWLICFGKPSFKKYCFFYEILS